MIHTLALISLSAPLFSAPAADVPLTAALPADTVAAVHLPNPKRLVAMRDTNDWVAFAMDAEWNRFIGAFMQVLGDDIDPAEVPAWRDTVLSIAADTTGLIVFMSGDVEGDDSKPTIGLLARGGEATGAHLRKFIGTDARPQDIGEGRTALMGESGRAELFYESGPLFMVLSTPTLDESKTLANACLGALAVGEPGGPFALAGLNALRDDRASIEVALNLKPVWAELNRPEAAAPDEEVDEADDSVPASVDEQMEEAMEALEAQMKESLQTVEWALMSGTFGLDEAAEWSLYAPYDEESLVGDMLGFFGVANKSLFDRVPAGSVSATVGQFDTHGFTEWTLGTLKGASEMLHAQADGAINSLKGLVGIDLRGDVLANMNGDFLGFSSAPSTNSPDIGGMVMGMQRSTLVVGFDDPEPMIDVVETIVDLSGVGAELSSETADIVGSDEELEVWRANGPDALMGLDAFLAVGAGQVVLSTDSRAAGAYLNGIRGASDSKYLLEDKALKAAVGAAEGSIITIQPTVAGADILEGVADIFDQIVMSLDSYGLGDDDDETSLDAGDAIRGVGGLFRQYFAGTTTTTMEAKAGLMRMRVLAR